ncbi:MAG: glutaminase A [Alphaproteobacteria bacterium]|jgi:glutaminase|nr:glutaminase A [Alphaproteobacteria bacterium]
MSCVRHQDGAKMLDEDYQALLEELHETYKSFDEGTLPTYIPELSLVNPQDFGISLTLLDGRSFHVGHSQRTFTIQSMVKPFLYGIAMEQLGEEAVLERIGVEPTGDAFNTIKLQPKTHRPYNPMVNAGAIVLANLIQGDNHREKIVTIKKTLEDFSASDLGFDIRVYTSEKAMGHHNRAMAYLMLNFGILTGHVEEILESYFQACSFMVTTKDLAAMAATLANKGVNPLTQKEVMQPRTIKNIVCVMMTCGMYDFAGQWSYTVGIPAKSGVSGGIIGVVPGRMGISVYSPLLDETGTSVRGIRVFQELSRRLDLSIY